MFNICKLDIHIPQTSTDNTDTDRELVQITADYTDTDP